MTSSVVGGDESRGKFGTALGVGDRFVFRLGGVASM